MWTIQVLLATFPGFTSGLNNGFTNPELTTPSAINVEMAQQYRSPASTRPTTTPTATPTTSAQLETRASALDKVGDTSVGLKWGDLTGVEFKHWHRQNNAVVLGVAFNKGNTAVGVDYLWHFRGSVEDVTGVENTNAFVPYAGAGLIGAFGGSGTRFFNYDTGDFGLALRAPLGVEYLTRRRFSVFAEVAPSFGFVPTSYTFMTADVGARYYF